MKVEILDIPVGGGSPLVLIAGPCVVESREMTLETAGAIRRICDRHRMPFVFKSSYKKANRTSRNSFSTLGEEKALAILREVKAEFGVPVLTDIHSPAEAALAADVADVIQIPAFLCRQTDLLEAAGKTGKVINIKKGQFLAPDEMEHVAEKVQGTGNNKILLTERGTTFGYRNLVVDMRSLVIMRSLGFPVVMDATHSVQIPGGNRDQSGGQPQFIGPLARAAVAAGCDAVFVETHPDPPKALSDAASQLKLQHLDRLVQELAALDRVRRELKIGATQ
ncbi:MAG: 3-deoxy-8-phosphooctulonate synthase [Ignavibacteria bacterium]|nr:3-deoxy-8-phosphooctulonate synthase [Ignavibacteria bacterium]